MLRAMGSIPGRREERSGEDREESEGERGVRVRGECGWEEGEGERRVRVRGG